MATTNILSDWLAFQDTIEDLENIDRELQLFATKIVDEMRRDVPKDKKKLMKSIKFNTDRFGFKIQMLEYGFYQNYGVNAKSGINTPIRDLTGTSAPRMAPYGVTDPINMGPFNYKPENRKFGLPATKFFDLADIQRRLIDLVEEQINND